MLPLDELASLIRQIPPGKAISYGDLGRSLTNPTSGYFVGRWIAMLDEPTPWWRVVAKGGWITTHKRSPELGQEQILRLQDEGINVEGGRVPPSALIDLL